jgi:predicted nuclease of predicted toxin-antitoxin system
MASILLDSCVWSGSLPILTALGHDVIWTGSWAKDPGDVAILAAAYSQKRILITLDKDFGELAILKGHSHSGIVRISAFRATQIAAVIHHIIQIYGQELNAGAIITVNPDRIRIRSK